MNVIFNEFTGKGIKISLFIIYKIWSRNVSSLKLCEKWSSPWSSNRDEESEYVRDAIFKQPMKPGKMKTSHLFLKDDFRVYYLIKNNERTKEKERQKKETGWEFKIKKLKQK